MSWRERVGKVVVVTGVSKGGVSERGEVEQDLVLGVVDVDDQVMSAP